MKFKAGDKVTVESAGYRGFPGVVYSVNSHTTAPYPYGVKLYVGAGIKYSCFSEDELSTRNIDREAVETAESVTEDKVNSPSHYTWLPNGFEVIDLTELLNFNRGNAVKYISRAGRKSTSTELEDLKKAQWYINREINRLEKGNANG